MILHAYNNCEIIEVQLILINTRCYSYFYYYYYLYLSYTTSEVAVRHVDPYGVRQWKIQIQRSCWIKWKKSKMIYQKLVFLSLTRFSIILTVGDAILMILFATVAGNKDYTCLYEQFWEYDSLWVDVYFQIWNHKNKKNLYLYIVQWVSFFHLYGLIKRVWLLI